MQRYEKSGEKPNLFVLFNISTHFLAFFLPDKAACIDDCLRLEHRPHSFVFDEPIGESYWDSWNHLRLDLTIHRPSFRPPSRSRILFCRTAMSREMVVVDTLAFLAISGMVIVSFSSI